MPQQNLQTAARRIPQTFDLRPSERSGQSANTLLGYPDELMIDWGNTPLGSKLQIYWPQASSSDVIRLAMLLYATEAPRAVDLNTVECAVNSRVTFVPIPFGVGGNLAGLFTIELPPGIMPGQEFHVVVRRISTRQTPAAPVIATRRNTTAKAPLTLSKRNDITRDWRYVVGTFQITIPVETNAELLVPEERTLSIMKWRLLQTPITNRWHPVLKRYVSYLVGRVDVFGGNAGGILPSPIGHLPPSTLPKGCEDTVEHTGKVCEVLFNCFGDFEGFVLNTCSETIAFHSCERGIAEIVLRACKDRLPLSVFVEPGPLRKICKLVVRC
jgi:hypothetical protein